MNVKQVKKTEKSHTPNNISSLYHHPCFLEEGSSSAALPDISTPCLRIYAELILKPFEA